MIKVTRYKEEGTGALGYEDYRRTFKALLQQIFPDDEYNQKYNGVNFRAVTKGNYWHPRLLGIRIESGSYGNTLRRRVMIKDDMIDDGKVKRKYEECRLHAIEDAKRVQTAQEKHLATDRTHTNLLQELGIVGDAWHCGLDAESETTVKLYGKANWTALRGLAELLGRKLELAVSLSIPIDKAKEAYRILYPEKPQ